MSSSDSRLSRRRSRKWLLLGLVAAGGCSRGEPLPIDWPDEEGTTGGQAAGGRAGSGGSGDSAAAGGKRPGTSTGGSELTGGMGGAAASGGRLEPSGGSDSAGGMGGELANAGGSTSGDGGSANPTGGQGAGGASHPGGAGSGGMSSTGGNEAPSGGEGTAIGSGGGGSGGAPHDQVPLQVGRLSFTPSFCWVRKSGMASHVDWDSARSRYETAISAWQGASALRIQWVGLCQAEAPDRGGEVRILLDDRAARSVAIDGCAETDRPGPWAVYPQDAPRYANCEWNMVLPFGLERKNPILHAAGHALGFSHQHVADISPDEICPSQSPGTSFSPYLDAYDVRSVMHPRWNDADSYGGNPWLDCPEDPEELALPFQDELSAGDLLALEMIYPLPGAPAFGSSVWLLAARRRTFREDGVLLKNDWLARRASVNWFSSPYWSIARPDGTLTLHGEAIARIDSDATSSLQVAHIFTDPFGQIHSLTETVSVSTFLHTAVLIAGTY